MKNILRSKFLLSVFVLIIFHVDCIAQNDTVYVSEFGVHPYTYENCVAQIQSAINACKARVPMYWCFLKDDTIFGLKML